ncbi:MAG: YqhA family protein [Pirellulales bacterium]|nr:YqhA family protein [Pirellulales bacterium]
MIQRILAACRYLMIAPVLGSIVLAAVAVSMGVARILSVGRQLWAAQELSVTASKNASVAVIEIIDLFLVGTVAYVTAIGLYKLFISDKEVELPVRIQIRSLKDLENKIVGLIVAALGVAFLGQAVQATDPMTVWHYGSGIALVIASLGLFAYLCGDVQK